MQGVRFLGEWGRLQWGEGLVLIVNDQRSFLGGFFFRFDSVFVDCIFNFLQFFQCVQIRGFFLFFQFFVDIGVIGQAAGSFRYLGLNGKFSFQAFQFGFLWEGEYSLDLRGCWVGRYYFFQFVFVLRRARSFYFLGDLRVRKLVFLVFNF